MFSGALVAACVSLSVIMGLSIGVEDIVMMNAEAKYESSLRTNGRYLEHGSC
jgi:hypothetical protein